MQDSDGLVRFDAAFLADPFDAYAKLRQAKPVHRAHTPTGEIWLVTRYADVRAALADPRLSVDKKHSKTGYQGFSLPPALDANLLNMDPPQHTRLRRLVAQAFTPRRTERLRGRVQEITDELLDALEGRSEADLLAEFAAPLPITVICELLGVPEADRPDFRAWTDEMLAPDPANPRGAKEAVLALHRFLVELVATKRGEPGEDLLSTLIELRDGQARLSEDELISTAFIVLFAGYENTVNLLGNGIAALLTHPEQLAALRADPESLPTAIEELLRFDPPPQLAIRRFAVEDMEIGGTPIPAGDTVMLSLVSAHRDPDQFDEPDELRLSRRENPHLGFGHGPHFCIGASLARMETEVGIGTLVRRFNLALAVPAEELSWRPSFRNRGLRTLPVSFSRA